MENELREKIERLRIKSEQLLSENKRAFIIDTNNSYYFCDLILIEKNKLTFKPFKGNNFNEKITKYWVDIIRVDEYREVKK